MTRLSILAWRAALAGVLIGFTSTSWPDQPVSSDPRSAMHQAFDALAYLLPVSVQFDGDHERGDRELIAAKLRELTSAAADLDQHARIRDAEFQSIARSFATQIAAMDRAFHSGYTDEMRYLLTDLSQNCVACHSRLPAESEFPFGQLLLARMNIDAMDDRDVAQLKLATRQFDSALSSLEKVIADPALNPVDLDMDGTIMEHLNVSITVLQDPDRARSMLSALAARDDVPYYLLRYVGAWQRGIDSVEGDLAGPPELDRARRLFNQWGHPGGASSGRETLVYDLAAAGLLRRFTDQASGQTGEAMAEAYYMLGVIELRTMNPHPAVPQMEFLLDAAIRSDPHGPYAQAAYALLEEYSYLSYSGTGAYEGEEPLLNMLELRGLIGIEESGR